MNFGISYKDTAVLLEIINELKNIKMLEFPESVKNRGIGGVSLRK